MKQYQRKRKNDYYLPHDVYMQVRYKLSGYERLKKERIEIYNASPPPPDGLPKGSQRSNPTQHKAILLANIDNEIKIIEQCCLEMKQVYAERILPGFDPLKAFRSYAYFNLMLIRADVDDEGPTKRAWSYYKSIFSYKMAHYLYLV